MSRDRAGDCTFEALLKLAATFVFLLVVVLAILAGPAAAQSQSQPAKVRLIMQWVHQAQFAGYFVAFEKGIYRQRGLDVEILRGGPGRNPEDLLRRGEAELGTFFLAGALVAIDRGAPLVHLAQVFNRSHLMLVAWRSKGIAGPQDLDGRRVSLWGEEFSAAFHPLFAATGVAPVLVPQFWSIDLFLRRGVDACGAMHYNEYHAILQAGVEPEELTTIFLRDHGLGFPEDGLYCLDSFARDHPDLVRAFAEASLEGWKRAATFPEEALAIVMRWVREAHIPTNRAHMRWMLHTVLPSVFPQQGQAWAPGVLSRADYERTVEALRSARVIKNAPAYATFRAPAPTSPLSSP